MKTPLFFLLAFFAISGKSQPIDSTFPKKILSEFYTDTGTFLPDAEFIDENGKKKTLADFKGKILYIDVWSTYCAPCLVEFPYQKQLFKRLKALQLDTAIQLITLNYEDTKTDWKKALKKYNPEGVNLFTTDTLLAGKWNVETLPNYLIIDTNGKVLGKHILRPSEAGSIDYLLYAAAKGMNIVKAMWTEFEQKKLLEKYRSDEGFTDKDYAKWHASLKPLMNEYFYWQREHMKKIER